jgi:hypothetical protein
MALFKKIKSAFRQLPKRKNKKPNKNQTIKDSTDQAIIVPDYEVIDSKSGEDAEAHRTTAHNTIEGSGYPHNLSLLNPNYVDLDILTLNETETTSSTTQSFDEVKESSADSEPVNTNAAHPSESPGIEDSDCDILDEEDASTSSQVPNTPVPSLKSESSTCDIIEEDESELSIDQNFDADSSIPAILSEEEDEEFFPTTEYPLTPQNRTSTSTDYNLDGSEITPRANQQTTLDTDAEVLIIGSSADCDSTTNEVESVDSIESHTTLENACTFSNEFIDIGFNIEEVIFTDVNAMVRHYSKAERGKRITVNPFRLERVEGVVVDLIVGEFDDDAIELTDEVIEKELSRGGVDVWLFG